MSRLQWVTPANLGVIKENWYFEKQLLAVNTSGADITYMLVTNDLNGISLKSNGLLYGTPVLDEVPSAEQNYYRKITVRAVDTTGDIIDRTFNLAVSGAVPPTIVNTEVDLGVHTDGEYFEYQFTYEDPNTYDNLTWKLVAGELPNGITLSNNGFMQGFLMQNLITDDGDISNLLGWGQSPWDSYIFDFSQNQSNRVFTFTLELSDGIYSERRTFTITVLAKDLLIDPTHAPILTTPSGTLPQIKSNLARQQTYFAFKFSAIDFDGDEVLFKIASYDDHGYEEKPFGDNFSGTDYPLPISIGLNEESGWLTGYITKQLLNSEHEFYVYPVKKRDPTIEGHRVKFKLVIGGLIDNEIVWKTNNHLGSIRTGEVSYFSVEATNISGKEIIYKLDSSVRSRTPQGISFLSDGTLYGRATFNYFTLDKKDTTFDGGSTTFDQDYQFTVIAENIDGTARAVKTFNLSTQIPNNYYGPYENLYIQGFPPSERRHHFNSIFNNETIFPTDALFRPNDPWFGKSQNFKFLFLPGIKPNVLQDYVDAIKNNHYIKTIEYGDIKTASAINEQGNVVYEVVYFEVVDTLEGKSPITGQPIGVPNTIDLSTRQHFYNLNGVDITDFRSNGLSNMESVVANYLGINEYNSLPLWMVSPQPDPDNIGQMLPPLGFVKAVVVAYTKPGKSKLIAYRLKNAGVNLNSIPFTFDRYNLDNYLTKNYDLIEKKFISSFETRFDVESSVAEHYVDTNLTVDYATNFSFLDVHGKTVNEIITSGALGDISEINTSEKVIFTRPDEFGDTQYKTYQDYLLNGDVNETSSIFAITVNPTTSVVSLSIFRATSPGDIVYVTGESQYMVFESYITFGSSPRWKLFEYSLNELIVDVSTNDGINNWKVIGTRTKTTFDKGSTSFRTNKDSSAPPDVYDKYLKFPKNGVFE